MKIDTQSLAVEDPKNPEDCNVFKLFQVVAPENDVQLLKSKYLKGGVGYGEAKELLFNTILQRFSENREEYFKLLENKDQVEALLLTGAQKARKQAQKVLKRVRTRVGF